jgi:hypothetical protein
MQIVYDKDSFKNDDFMGEAEIDIQPLVSAAKAYEKSSINESMQLGKWVASGDNTLVKDGIISLEEGKVRQDISLRLQNVERGVLEINLNVFLLLNSFSYHSFFFCILNSVRHVDEKRIYELSVSDFFGRYLIERFQSFLFFSS